jgi:hypothetical protein
MRESPVAKASFHKVKRERTSSGVISEVTPALTVFCWEAAAAPLETFWTDAKRAVGEMMTPEEVRGAKALPGAVVVVKAAADATNMEKQTQEIFMMIVNRIASVIMCTGKRKFQT